MSHTLDSNPNGVPTTSRGGDPFAAIDIRQLSIHYESQCVLRDVTLMIPRGRITALIGPSGCGKTSLLTSLNRLTDLIPGCRVAGRVQLDELDILSAATDVIRLRRRVGMIFQKPNPFPLSIRRNLELAMRDHGVRERSELSARVERSLREVGLWDEVKDRLDAPALSLSGGQQQRLCIARALALDPEVLLLDEPCSALDALSIEIVERWMTSTHDRMTLIIVTHNLGQARRVADEVAFFWIQNGVGQLVEHGDCHQIFREPSHPLTQNYISGRSG